MEKIRRSTKELGEMCCGFLRTGGGIFGVILLLTGGLQIGIGLFFMLNLPGFVVASNIWTGFATGVGGVSLMYFAYTNNSRRRKNSSFLVLSIICLLVNILNVVVIQVGEKSKFLTQEKLKILEQDSDAKFVFDLAIIASTIISSIVLVITFVVSQFLFCGHLMKPKLKHQIAIIEPSERAKENDVKGSRFFPPSRLVAKVDVPSSVKPNGLWIPRKSSSGTWHEGGDGSGVICNTVRAQDTVVVVKNDTMERLTGMGGNIVVGDTYHGSRLSLSVETNSNNQCHSNYNQSRFSTFIPKKRRNTKQEKDFNLENVSANTSSTVLCADDSNNIPTFLQNHPESWMFLFPNTGDENNASTSKIPSPSDALKNELKGNSSEKQIDQSRISSTEMLLQASPRPRSKLKRPLDTPPLPPK